MLDIPHAHILDKDSLVGGCVRLPLKIDDCRLRAEISQLPASAWGAAGRLGVHRAAEALFLRGYAPAEGEKPIEDRAALALLPYARWIIEQCMDAPQLRCLLARLPAKAAIAPHVDRAPYFSKTLRLHMPVETNDMVFMVVAGLSYRMRPGEVWVLNNSARHAVWNAHPVSSRTHLICDFLPSPTMLEWLACGERDLGAHLNEVDRFLNSNSVIQTAS